MAASRERILGAIRQALAAGPHLPEAPAAGLHAEARAAGQGQEALAARFRAELEALSGRLEVMPSAQVAGWLAGQLRAWGADEVLSWEQAELPVPGLLTALREQGMSIVTGALPPAEPGRSETLARWERIKVGLTGAEAAFAETGTLAVRAGPGRPRLASLLVERHVALLTPDQMYASWADWLARGGEAAGRERLAAASNLTLISGPSRTADIEMTLTVGVHGPGEVVVVLVTA
jgi:L-lactate dehydrogenase complex protein LldG